MDPKKYLVGPLKAGAGLQAALNTGIMNGPSELDLKSGPSWESPGTRPTKEKDATNRGFWNAPCLGSSQTLETECSIIMFITISSFMPKTL